jgi:hypothetical protein
MRSRSALVLTFVALFLLPVRHSSVAQQLLPPSTFSKDVAPILYKNCVSCHRPGEMGPMSLVTYEQARPWARAIRAKVAEGSMPPWHSAEPPGTFLNERRLTSNERDIIIKWVDSGAPQGDSRDMPSLPQFASGWTIGTPDAVFKMGVEFEVPASGEVPYQYFEIPTDLKEDKWVQAIEIRPGTPSVVHHILAFSREPNATPRPPAFTPTNAATAAAPRLAQAVQTARQRGQVNRGVLIATTAPGTNAQVFQPGQAMLIKAGSVLTFQVHYTVSGKAVKDRSSIGFVFAKEPPKQEVRSGSFTNAFFVIPPRASNHRVDSAIEFNQDADILAVFPHTHLRGKSWEYRLVYPDGRKEVVLSVPKYDFNWQTYYEYSTPIHVPGGSRLEATAHYDNSAANRANPDPNVEVRWGDQTWEEMQYTGITYVVK